MLAVAGLARGRRDRRRMRGLHVTIDACGMAAARGRARDGFVTAAAQGRVGDRPERAVGLVAVGARGVTGVPARAAVSSTGGPCFPER